jgi:hypothetical protein
MHLDHRFFDRHDLPTTTALCLPLPLWRPRQPHTEQAGLLLYCSHSALELAGDHGCFCFLAHHRFQHLNVFFRPREPALLMGRLAHSSCSQIFCQHLGHVTSSPRSQSQPAVGSSPQSAGQVFSGTAWATRASSPTMNIGNRPRSGTGGIRPALGSTGGGFGRTSGSGGGGSRFPDMSSSPSCPQPRRPRSLDHPAVRVDQMDEATAPPSPAINSRHFIRSPCRRGRAARVARLGRAP